MAVGEWDQRQLCPDGACVGVIGPDGTCKVCGRAAPNWGDERKRGLIDPPDEEDEEDDDDDDEYDGAEIDDQYDDEDDDDEDDDAAEDDAPGIAAAPPGWASRRLCSDGSCIGVIGLDGRCKVCGRSASGAEPVAAEPPADSSAPGSGDPDDNPSDVN